MNKSDLIRQLAERADLSRAEATRAVDALFAVENGIIAESLRGGDKVQITGFGSFEAKRREARKGRNPRTGREIDITPSTSASFRVGKSLKDSFGDLRPEEREKKSTKKGTGGTGPRRT